MHPEATDFWDGNWLFSPLEVMAGGFTARIPAGLRAEELRSFREGLALAYDRFGGEARLVSMEPWIDLVVRVGKSGRVEATGRVIDRLGGRNELTFYIDELDQTHLPALIDALTGIEERFPVIGDPSAGGRP